MKSSPITFRFRWLGWLLLFIVLADLAVIFVTNARFPGSRGLPKTLLTRVRGEGRSYTGVIERTDSSFQWVSPSDPKVQLRLQACDPHLIEVLYYEHATSSGIFSPSHYLTSGIVHITNSDAALLHDEDRSDVLKAFANYLATERRDPARAARLIEAPWSQQGWIWTGIANDAAIAVFFLVALFCLGFQGNPENAPSTQPASHGSAQESE